MQPQQKLKVSLLRQQPSIMLEETPLEFGGQPFEFFIYLADTHQDVYLRHELGSKLYGPDAPLKVLRQNALFNLPPLLKEHYLETSEPAIIRFRCEEVWTDSQEFMRRASVLMAQAPLNSHAQIQEAQEILELYQHHFLEGYFPKAEGLVVWREERQEELARLRHNLFDQIIQFYLWHASLVEAQEYAERWWDSLEPGYIPLQYLIWITANRRQYADLEGYLDELGIREKKEKNTSPIGLSAVAWRRHLQKHTYWPLSLLRLTTYRVNEAVSSIREDSVVGQELVLREVLTILTERNNTKILALTGLPGAGKTTLAQIAAQTLYKMNSGYEIVYIQLKPDPDFESILNSILEQFRMEHVIPFNYVKKQRYVKQLLQRRRCLILIDEGNTRKLSDSTVFQTLLNTLNDAFILFVAQQIPDENCFSISVEGLTPKHARLLLVREFPELGTLDDVLFADIVHITGGLPLGLNLITGFLKEQRFQLRTFADALKQTINAPLNQDNVYSIYEGILAWMWQTLSRTERLILHAVSMFDTTNGATVDDIAIVCNDLRDNTLSMKINTLSRMSLLRSQQKQDSPARYTLHSIIFNFIRGKALQLTNQPSEIGRVEQAYIRHFLNYLEVHRLDFPKLDDQRENIIHMFELVLLSDQHRQVCIDAAEALCMIYPYLEKRGLYNVADRLISSALKWEEISATSKVRVRLLHHAGQAAYKRSMLDTAGQYLDQAIELAKTTQATELYSAIYLDQGLIYLQSGRYLDAMNNFEEANQWALEHDQLLLLCRITVNSGVCAHRQGHYQLSKQYYEHVWDYIADQNPQDLPYELKDVVQTALIGLGLAASEQWDHPQAEAFYQRAMEIARQVNNPERIGYLYVNLGVSNFFMKAYDAAQEYFLQGKIIAEHIQHDELATLVMRNQGALSSAKRAYEEAAELLKTALIQATELGLSWLQSGIYVALGKLYFRQESLQKAEQCFLNALKKAGRNPKHCALALYGLGLVEVSPNDIIGTDDISRATEQMGTMLSRLEIDPGRLCDLSYDELDKAQNFFQHDLESYPEMFRFRIAEGLWACRPDGSGFHRAG
jgi:tetratricopeptide (TPR) repeat protein